MVKIFDLRKFILVLRRLFISLLNEHILNDVTFLMTW
jgi:hypothetical protein